jgi:hypothetical protein
LSWVVTSLGILAGFSTANMGTSYLVGGVDKGYPDWQRGGRLYQVRCNIIHLLARSRSSSSPLGNGPDMSVDSTVRR